MSDNSANSPATATPHAGTASPGAILRALREEAGLSLATVGEALHLTAHYIKALEGDEYGKLPGLTFVKGYLRSYARYIKADVDMVLACFDQHIASLVDAGIRTGEVQRSRRRHDQALRWAFATGFIIVAGLVGGWWYKGQDDQPAAPNARAAVTAVLPTQATPPPTATVVETPQTLANVTVSPPAITSPEIPLQYAAAIPALDADTPDTGLASVAVAEAELDPVTNENLSIIAAANGTRQLMVAGEGEDLLQLSFTGNSWVEIDDATMDRLYNDMLRAGDALTVQGDAPFYILLGDAREVDVRLNSEAVNITADIRPDSTARLVLDDVPVTDAFAAETPASEPAASEPPASEPGAAN